MRVITYPPATAEVCMWQVPPTRKKAAKSVKRRLWGTRRGGVPYLDKNSSAILVLSGSGIGLSSVML